MPSYTTSLRLIQPATGEYSGSWGTQVNNGITALVDTSVAGTASITMTAADYTLSTANGATDEARAMFLVLGGTPGAARNVICPAVSKLYYVTNNTTGGFAQTVKTASGSGISVPNGASMVLRCDGTNVVEAQNALGSIVLNGGTANGVAYLNASKALTTGSALVFDGTNFSTTGTATATKLIPTGGSATGNGMYLPAANTLAWSTNGAETMRLDASGNLGLGVAPSASWGAGAEAFQIATQGQSLSALTASSQVNLSSNAVFDGTNWLYGVTAASGRYQIDANTHAWFRASSGTAGNAITYTQGMTLDSSGRLLVNTSSIVGLSSSQKFQVVTTTEVFTGSLARYSNNANSCGFYFFKSRGATIGTSASVNQGDGVGILGFSADTGSSQSAEVVRIATYVDGAVTAGSTAIPGGLTISTGAGVSSTPTIRLRIDSNGCFTQQQAAESAQNTSATLTVAQLRAGIITSNAAVTLTLPTGTDLETYTLFFTTDTAFECVFIATTANAITIAANGNTTVGNLTVSGNTSGTFRFRKTNTNTFTVYRVA